MTIKISQLGTVATVQGNVLVPVVSNITGTQTTVTANVDVMKTFITASAEANIIAANAATVFANTLMKGYVDGQITAANSTVTTANVGIIGYVDQSNSSLKTYVDGQITAANSAVTTANLGLKGYVDQANTIQSGQLASANLGIIGYVDLGNTIQSAQVGAANLAITAANVGMKGYVDSQSFYSNAKVATYLPTYGGNVNSLTSTGNITVGGLLAFGNSYIPSLANSAGVPGTIVYNSNYIYICIATDTWKRANISTW